ncbi:beta-barrel fold lipoprotein [Winogradskyella sediminis]|uniref:beta-barrel fold lipoprotein n=1 Tax=Winogradskyella sediminis TaxID=1382466 RepID=UPI000E270D39|nr:hypothetical protein [Winogradskyella sediminis]REG88774.1 hypothetical protein C8N41_1014 [Winogradskyella sediminis]
MKKKFLIGILSLGFAFLGCEQDDIERANRVSFENETVEVQVPRDAIDFQRPISIYVSEVSGSDRVFQIAVNDEESTLESSEYSIPSSVTVPANSKTGEFIMTVSDVSLSFEAKTLSLQLLSDDDTYTGNAMLFVTERCDDTVVGLNLAFDDYAEEAYWDLYDLSGTPTIIFSGGQGSAYDELDNGEFDIEFCLASGNYGIVVYDGYGDGGTTFTVSAGETVLASGTVPGGNPANVPTNITSLFTVD